MYIDKSGKWRWRFIAPNNRKMAESTTSYQNEESCLNAIQTIKRKSREAKTTKLVPA
jgi:uncharacterized protein YegP (UPF0339 family)